MVNILSNGSAKIMPFNISIIIIMKAKTIQKPEVKPKKVDELAVNQQGKIKKVSKNDPEYFDPKTLKFSFDLGETDYKLDRLQEKFLQFYLRADPKFRRAFMSNYTADFLGYIRDKAQLFEPIHLSIMGSVRSGKSSIALTLASYHQAIYNKKMSADYICGQASEFVELLKEYPPEKLTNRCFVIDEEKGNFNIGSMARKQKMQDIQNIIAVENISTISLCPTKFQNAESSAYGIRIFGRDFVTKTCRMMLYNLQESAKLIPVGNLYLPIFNVFLPKDYAEKLNNDYLKKKMNWVKKERMGEGNSLVMIRKKTAEHFIKDSQYKALKTHDEKVTYLQFKLGNDWTNGEIESIFQLTKLLEKGIKFDEKD